MKMIPKNSKIIVIYTNSSVEKKLNEISQQGYDISNIFRDGEGYIIIAYRKQSKQWYPLSPTE